MSSRPRQGLRVLVDTAGAHHKSKGPALKLSGQVGSSEAPSFLFTERRNVEQDMDARQLMQRQQRL